MFGSIYVFFTVFGYWARGGGGVCKEIGTEPVYAVFIVGSSKSEVFETYFVDTVTTQNDHPRYVKHVLGSIYVFWVHVARGRFSARWTCRRQ